jgi:outer membrane immunogenic protein
MKRLSMTMSIGLLVAAMAAPSFAADLPRPSYKAPIYAPSYYNWTGFYAGINAGYGFGKSDWSGAGGTGSTKPKGFIGGVQLGYNLQTGSWVWGLEADFDYSAMKGSDSGGTGVCSGAGSETKLKYFGTGRGRLGYAGWDRWLPYDTGGVAYGNIKATPAFGGDFSKGKVGWTVGGGVEYAVFANWTTKLEYLYADLGSISGGTPGNDVTFKSHLVRAGLNYRF